MKSSLLSFMNEKIKPTYKFILVTIFVSVFLLNGLIQIMMLSFTTLNNELLNNHDLSLIVMQSYDEGGQVYEIDIQTISNLDHVVFVSRHQILGLLALDENGDTVSFWTRPIPKVHSYYIGLEVMLDNRIYCPIHLYGNIEHYEIQEIESAIDIINYEGMPPFVVADFCFTTEETYATIYSELSEYVTMAIMPEYLIGVDNVRNIFSVVRELYSLSDDSMILFQATGLEEVIEDISLLLVVLLILFFIVSAFNTYIVFLLSSSLIEKVSRDLMILYLNGMSRKEIAAELSRHFSKHLNMTMLIATACFLFAWFIFINLITRQRLTSVQILIILLINALVILANSCTLKIMISTVVKKKTSNENISKVIRN